jgi:hypothetical protein
LGKVVIRRGLSQSDPMSIHLNREVHHRIDGVVNAPNDCADMVEIRRANRVDLSVLEEIEQWKRENEL